MPTRLLVHQSACTILVIAIVEEVQLCMWAYLGDVTDEKESTLKFLEKVKIAKCKKAGREPYCRKISLS